MNEGDKHSLQSFETEWREKMLACTHEHYGIIPANPWMHNARIECPDCGARWEWPTSGAKTRAQTIAEIRAWMAREG